MGGIGLYEDPRTSQDWEDVALERRADAMELHRAGRHLACLYYLGFTAECFAKALCAAQGRPAPRGHDILALMVQAGFSPAVLAKEVREFLMDRDVGLRYQTALPEDVKIEDEIEAAKRFVSWCTTQLRRRHRTRGAGARRRKTS
ncbi:HEPN domain-containing protein [Streptomyces sp. NPDC001744]|uniref:HEPN domain-containing protein n=1 Tax=Streptomyces sp. NPDC001744 TaxID=3364606 RepID=UPI0036D0D02E